MIAAAGLCEWGITNDKYTPNTDYGLERFKNIFETEFFKIFENIPPQAKGWTYEENMKHVKKHRFFDIF